MKPWQGADKACDGCVCQVYEVGSSGGSSSLDPPSEVEPTEPESEPMVDGVSSVRHITTMMTTTTSAAPLRSPMSSSTSISFPVHNIVPPSGPKGSP